MTALRTPRLLLRPWRDTDLAPFAALNADPEVSRWFAGTLTREESDALAARHQEHIATHGFGFWAVEAPGTAPFIGFVGLKHVAFAAPSPRPWRSAGGWRARIGAKATPRKRPAPRLPTLSGHSICRRS